MFDDLDAPGALAGEAPAPAGVQATVDEQLIERVLQDGGEASAAENGEAEIPEAEPAAKEPAAENAETPENPETSESPEDSTASVDLTVSQGSVASRTPKSPRRLTRCSAAPTTRSASARFRTPRYAPRSRTFRRCRA